VLTRLERLFSGRDVWAGDRAIDIEEVWPQKFLGMLSSEIRRMLQIRARLEESGPGAFDASMSYGAFQTRVLPRLMAPVVPFGRSPFETSSGGAHPFAMYKAAQRSSRFTKSELIRALSRAADVDVALKNSSPVLETLSVYVGELVAGS
jgi:hypothetical protein